MTGLTGCLSDFDLDAAILRELFPENQKTAVQLSVDIERSGGAIRTGIRCLELQERKLIFLAYDSLSGTDPYWRLSVRGKWEVQKTSGQEGAGVATIR